MPGMGRCGEKFVDQAVALVGAGVGQKRADSVDGGDRTDEVDRDAAEKIGVGADRGQRTDGIRFDAGVDGCFERDRRALIGAGGRTEADQTEA